jgi:hypothetical protein
MSAHVKTRLLPQIRLRTLFLLFVCAAVGLATYREPLGAFEPAIATAMVIGLLQQSRQLWHWEGAMGENDLAFARRFGLVWRIGGAAVISSCLLLEMLINNEVLQLSDEQRVRLTVDALLPITSLSLTAVLCNSVARWRSATAPNASIIALLVLIQGSLFLVLVHESLAGVEASVPARFQRPGVYPDLGEEWYGLFWVPRQRSQRCSLPERYYSDSGVRTRTLEC